MLNKTKNNLSFHFSKKTNISNERTYKENKMMQISLKQYFQKPQKKIKLKPLIIAEIFKIILK